jgi:hypothetical protein
LKSTVYIETSIISYLTARQSNDLRSMANKSATIEWWETQRPKYELVVSEFVIAEAGLGHLEAAERRLAAIEGIESKVPGSNSAHLPSDPPSEEGSPGEVRSRCPSIASLATGPAGLSQRGVSAGFRRAN